MPETRSQITIKKCSNPLLWYSEHIGEEFEVSFEESNAYWTREKQHPHALNWVYKDDCVLTHKLKGSECT